MVRQQNSIYIYIYPFCLFFCEAIAALLLQYILVRSSFIQHYLINRFCSTPFRRVSFAVLNKTLRTASCAHYHSHKLYILLWYNLVRRILLGVSRIGEVIKRFKCRLFDALRLVLRVNYNAICMYYKWIAFALYVLFPYDYYIATIWRTV